MSPTKEGITFGIMDEKLGDVHLTIFYKDGKIRYHVTDKTVKKQCPVSTQFYPEIFFNKVKKKLKRIIKSYHGNKKTYAPKGRLKNKLYSIIDQYINNPDEIPLEFIFASVECDFKNKERWDKIKIRELLNEKYSIGFIEENNVIKYVKPLNNKIILVFSEKQYNNLLNLTLDFFGFKDYFDYIKNEKGFRVKI
jgi:hypothetical protein